MDFGQTLETHFFTANALVIPAYSHTYVSMISFKICQIFDFTEKKILISGKDTNTPDTLRFLIPGMCHLVAEDKPRKIILDMKMHETLFTYLSYHWSIFDSFKVWLQKHEGGVNVEEPKFMLESSNFEMVNSKFAMVTICNVLMNITVLEPGFVEDTPIFFNLLKFIMNSLPTLQNTGIYKLIFLGLITFFRQKISILLTYYNCF